MSLNLSDENFENEAGQKDGTLAHAVERLFAVGLIKSGLQLADSNYNENHPVIMVNKNHAFTL
jgi:O-antigen biosynthesis protein